MVRKMVCAKLKIEIIFILYHVCSVSFEILFQQTCSMKMKIKTWIHMEEIKRMGMSFQDLTFVLPYDNKPVITYYSASNILLITHDF